MLDPHDLQRFVDAQRSVYGRIVRELGEGRKRSHWMWFVFPQVAGLGSSAMARRYALADLAEARAYLAHAVLGPRLVECTTLVLAVDGRSAHQIFGSPDDLKFRSSMTLFGCAAGDRVPGSVFQRALETYFDGAPDSMTLARLDAGTAV